MNYTVDEFKDIMAVNDISFIYNGREYYIFQGSNSCIVGEYADDETSLTFNRFTGLNDNLNDTLENWLIEGKALKDIVNDIALL